MMEELTYPVELTDEELDLVAAGGGCERGSLINVSGNDIDVVQANVAVGSNNNQQNF
jgi:hypothetical protein